MSQRLHPKLPPVIHAPTRNANEEGSVLPFVAVTLGSLLLLLGLTLNLGQLFSANTQLQASADAASRAAANEMANQLLLDPDVPLDTLREAATATARMVLEERRVIQATGTSLSVEFGQFDFDDQEFSRVSSFVQPTAVRVTVQPESSSGGGAVRLLMPTSAVSDVELSRSSVSALRTTNRVFLVDVSSSFQDSIGIVKQVLRDNIDLLTDRGDVERVGIIPFRNRVVESRVVGLVEPTDARIRSTIDALDAPGVLCRFDGNVPFPECVGTDVAGAIDRALLMVAFQETSPSNTMITLLTDGEPCEIPREMVQSLIVTPAQPRPTTLVENPLGIGTGGGSSVDAAEAAGRRLCQRASLSTIPLDTGRDNVSCPSLNQTDEFVSKDFRFGLVSFRLMVQPIGRSPQEVFFKETSIDDELMSDLVCNFGRSFPSQITRSELARELRRAASTLPPVTVQ